MQTAHSFIDSLATPLVLAPMAGGPSTPELTAAVADAGGCGNLASGYLSPEKLAEHIARTQELTDGPFGINLFVPNRADAETDLGETGPLADWFAYRRRLVAEGFADDDALPTEPRWSDDSYAEKLALACKSSARMVSFTFGYPTAQEIERVHEAGKLVVLNATSAAGVRAAAAAGADIIGVQGFGAGGHRATVAGVDDERCEADTKELVELACQAVEQPIIAAGGVGTASDVEMLLAAGAELVQVGTRFLTAAEAGTKRTHYRALLSMDRTTTTTRAFSGKTARSITNDFIDTMGPSAPARYPYLHYLTAPLRSAADQDGNPESLNLWAGTGYRHCVAASAADIVVELTPGSARCVGGSGR